MGTIIVGGALFIVVGLIALNTIRKIRRGGSACCSGGDCGCGHEPHEKTHGCCSDGGGCQCHTQKTTVTK